MMRSDEERLVRPGLRTAAEHEPEDASMARSRSAAHKGEEEDEEYERHEEHESKSMGGKGGSGMAGHKVTAEHIMGEHESPHAAGAESMPDDASAKANRKEAMEPERERDEKAAVESRGIAHRHTMGGTGGPAHGQHTMGHGERKMTGKHTI